jgi:xanthine/uracil/vitamin C permease (AzgA family)
MVTAVLFAVGAFFAPIIGMVGGGYSITNATQYAQLVGSGFTPPDGAYYVYPITAGALIVVGFLMMRTVREIPWTTSRRPSPPS